MMQNIQLTQTHATHMATEFFLCISCPQGQVRSAQRTLRDAYHLIAFLENELTEFRLASPVWKVNHSNIHERIKAPESTLELLVESQRLFLTTRGFFDPSAKSIKKNWDHMPFGFNEHEIWKTQPGARLSFGAIGKGFALDRVRSLIETDGFSDYYLSAGGSSIIANGFESPGVPWNFLWGIDQAKTAEGQTEHQGVDFDLASGRTVFLGVSGFQEQGIHILHQGRRFPHSARPWIKSALVSANSAAEADALSTALFVESNFRVFGPSTSRSEGDGASAAIQLRPNLTSVHPGDPNLSEEWKKDHACAVVDQDDTFHWNQKFAERIGHLKRWAKTSPDFSPVDQMFLLKNKKAS